MYIYIYQSTSRLDTLFHWWSLHHSKIATWRATFARKKVTSQIPRGQPLTLRKPKWFQNCQGDIRWPSVVSTSGGCFQLNTPKPFRVVYPSLSLPRLFSSVLPVSDTVAAAWRGYFVAWAFLTRDDGSQTQQWCSTGTQR